MARVVYLAGVSAISGALDGARPLSAAEAGQAPPGGEAEREALMRAAFELRRLAIESSDQPFGAVVVKDGQVVGEGPSRVVVNGDPTAHAEVEAVRDAGAPRYGSC